MTKLEKAEAILAQLKALLRNTELWSELYVNHSEELGPGRPLCGVVLKTETPNESWNWFFSQFWSRSTRMHHHRPHPYHVARCEAPAWLTLTTENRQAFSQFVSQVAKTLEGQRVELQVESHDWTGYPEIVRKSGQSPCRTVFRLVIHLHAPVEFHAAPWLATALTTLSASADEHIPESVS